MVFGWMSSTSPARQGQISLGASVRVTRRSRWLQGMCSTSQGDDRCVVHGDVGEGHPERGHHLAAKRKRTFVVVPRRGGLCTRAILDEDGVHPETHGSRAHESRDELAGDAVMQPIAHDVDVLRKISQLCLAVAAMQGGRVLVPRAGSAGFERGGVEVLQRSVDGSGQSCAGVCIEGPCDTHATVRLVVADVLFADEAIHEVYGATHGSLAFGRMATG